MTSRRHHLAVLAGVWVLSLSGCSANEAPEAQPIDVAAIQAAVERGSGIDPASHAGDFEIRVPADIPIAEQTLPIVFYGGLSSVSDTRLGLNAFVDLRLAQIALPQLASGVINETCDREISVDLVETRAEGEVVHASGSVLLQLFFCDRSDPANETQGARWLSQRVDAVASAKANVGEQCIEFELVDLELDPRGLLGGISNLVGVTSAARSVILEEAGKFLSENPVCPTLPDELASLAPFFSGGGAREIGDGGIGVALAGSADTSASTIVTLLAVVERSEIVDGQE